MLILQSLVLWRTSSETGYLWLSVCLISLLTLELSAQGYWHHYVGGNNPWLSIRVVSLSSGIFLISYIQFSFAVVRSQFRSANLIVKWSNLLSAVCLFLLLFVIFGNFATAVTLLSSYAFIVSFILITLTLVAFKGVKANNSTILFVHVSIILLWVVRLTDLFGVDLLGETSFPRLAEYQYMYIWIGCGTAVYFFITRNTSLVLKNHLQWQQRLIKNMDVAVRDRTQKLTDAQQEALRLSAVQRDFLGIMSHELRTPLSAVVALGKMIADRQDSPKVTRIDAESIQRLSKHTLTMVDSAIAFVRDGTIDEREYRSSVEMASLKRDLASIGTWLAQKQSNVFELQFEVNAAKLIFDDIKLRQIVINLLSNAGRYCKGGRIELSVQHKPSSLFMDLKVSDSGRGMSSEELQKYLQPFVKSATSEGLGLGLHICRHLAVLIGARFTIESEEGLGTTVSLKVPVDLDQDFVPYEDSDFRTLMLSRPMPLDTPSADGAPLKHNRDEILFDLLESALEGRISDIESHLKRLKRDHVHELSTRFLPLANELLDLLNLDGMALLIKEELAK